MMNALHLAQTVPVLQLGIQQHTSMKPVVQFSFYPVNKISYGCSSQGYVDAVEITVVLYTVMV
jgi:hypothetical protein